MPENSSYRSEAIEGTYRQVDLDDEEGHFVPLRDEDGRAHEGFAHLFHQIVQFILFPAKLLWNILVIVAAIWLTIIWIGFVFGSVIGVVLLLIFMGLDGFFFPMGIVALCVPLWKKRMEDAPYRS